MNYTTRDHTFVVCAYKESPYLEECIQSLLNQTKPTNIKIVTSTPNLYIKNMAIKYSIDYLINTGEKGIVEDWNFAYNSCSTKLVTIAHQDDIYKKDYVSEMLRYINKSAKPLICFTDYAEIRDGETVYSNRLLKVKRLMLTPLKPGISQRSRFVRRRILSLGSPICCPSVTYVKDNLMNPIFQKGFKSDEDWQAWERISKLKGEFVYISKILVLHRIHEESATTSIIMDTGRAVEDYQMFCKFWPPLIARLLVKYYSKSEESNCNS